MRRTRPRAISTVAAVATLAIVGCLSAIALTATPARAAERPADQILADIDAVKMPRLDPEQQGETLAMIEFINKRKAAVARRGELIRELFQAEPDHPRLPALFAERWQNQLRTSEGAMPLPKLAAELNEVLGRTKNPKLKADAAFYLTILEVQTGEGGPDQILGAVEKFIKVAPSDERGAMLLNTIANAMKGSPRQAELRKRVAEDYPQSPYAESAKGTLRRLESVGKPFELEFKDAIQGTSIATKELKGKVIVIDFWATFCEPCVAAMPALKELYARYRGQGVEFIGVNLDAPKEEGGLDLLKEFVARNNIAWPQYYQGNGWESAFSRSWGIDAIPAMFVVDQNGILVSVDAYGRLEEILPEVLKKGSTSRPGE